jgi:hypothetical protein
MGEWVVSDGLGDGDDLEDGEGPEENDGLEANWVAGEWVPAAVVPGGCLTPLGWNKMKVVMPTAATHAASIDPILSRRCSFRAGEVGPADRGLGAGAALSAGAALDAGA